MAYAALVSLEQTTDMILKPIEYSISFDEREQIASIRSYVIFIIAFLENSPEKAIRLEGKIRDLANEAEDLIEFFIIQKSGMSFTRSRDEFQRLLKIVTEKIGLITGDMMDDRPCAAISSPRVAPTGKNDVVIGLDEDLTAIKDRICGESSRLEVIPIVGMGGIGKTTLARYAYDDALKMERFDIRAWVTISQDYSVDEILSRLTDSMKLLEENKMPMAEKVYKCLKGRRYLIVMDDVWRKEACDDVIVRHIFPDDNNGSRIMLTTRLSDVASYTVPEGTPVHEMKFMDENQSWNLLQQKVFTNGHDCPPDLEDMGKEIAQGCRGLPLAVVLVAGILVMIAKTRSSWEKILKNAISDVDGELEKILSMSYTHLPHHLRACFLYIGGFPEDYEIRAPRLIKLWVAEGFLKHENGCKSLEEEAEECLEDLVRRSLVLVTRKVTGEIKSCSLHDLVRDSCIRKAQEEMFLHDITDRYNLQQNLLNKRRISSISHSYHMEIQGPTIRTFLCLPLKDGLTLLDFVGRFRLLRVLDVVCEYLGVLPSQLFELILLRYLALGTPKQIPAAISNLHNLQTLIINPERLVRGYLPLEIWRMQQLRHLVFPSSYKLLIPLDGSTFPLENLQTLLGALNPACSKKILNMISNLKKLEIYFGNQTDLVTNFKYLDQLEKLKITSSRNCHWSQTYAFPITLKKLSLEGSFFSWNDMHVIGSLPRRQVLKLRGNYDSPLHTWETADGEFPQLRFLLIEGSHLGVWITESSHFPKLKCLVLRHCMSLQAIPDGIGDIPMLELIDVSYVYKSLADSAKQIQQEQQQDYENYTLQVRCTHVYIRDSE